jgi:hypothetical protein
MVRKLIAFDAETWHALRRLSDDSKTSLEALCETAFSDLLKKHGRPVRQGGNDARPKRSPSEAGRLGGHAGPCRRVMSSCSSSARARAKTNSDQPSRVRRKER